MKQINCTVAGVVTDTPVLVADSGVTVTAFFESPTRAIFQIADAVTGGATIAFNNGKTERVIVPLAGAEEGPLLQYGSPAVAFGVSGQRFVENGAPVMWRGCSEFRLPARAKDGEDILPVLRDRLDVGFNVLRSLAMKANNVGWTLDPRDGDYWDAVKRYFDAVGGAGLKLEWTVFADTKLMMPDEGEQVAFWGATVEAVRQYPFVVLELMNEYGHSTQCVDPSRFARPSGVLASHGSGLSDADVVQPLWDFATYHARRASHPGDARGATNYSPYAYQESLNKPCPYVPDEGDKPESYGFEPSFAWLMGRHASCGAGGTFHSNDGIQSVVFSPQTRACAAKFVEAFA